MAGQIDIEQHAEILFSAHQAHQSFVPFVGEQQIDSLADAYAIQNAYVSRLVNATGSAVSGFKIGLTSPRMQALLNIDSPIAGAVLGDRLFESGAGFARADYGQLCTECEIAVRIGRDLPPSAAPFDFEAVAAAVDGVSPAFEIVDDRQADYALTDIYSLVADNSWNAGVVLAPWIEAWPDLAGLEGVLTIDGEETDRGRGSDVLEHPFNALTWLANHLARGPRGLRAGDVVATGSMVPTRMPSGPEHCRFTIEGLGAVEIEITN